MINWAQLGTAAGVATVVMLLTQVIKQYITQIDPKWIALGLALLITYARQMVVGDLTGSAFVLSGLNAALATGLSIGVFEGIGKPIAQRRKE
jgi:hypothetical protein